MIKKEAEKILKYKDLIIEIQHMWHVKVKLILVIIAATETISKSLSQYLSNVPGKRKIKELQKTAVLVTAHILRRVLMYKYKTYCMDEITLHVAQIVNTEQLQQYIPWKYGFFFRYIIVNTLHKGDDKDDEDDYDDDDDNNNNTNNNNKFLHDYIMNKLASNFILISTYELRMLNPSPYFKGRLKQMDTETCNLVA